jgi:hypothetical protein
MASALSPVSPSVTVNHLQRIRTVSRVIVWARVAPAEEKARFV